MRRKKAGSAERPAGAIFSRCQAERTSTSMVWRSDCSWAGASAAVPRRVRTVRRRRGRVRLRWGAMVKPYEGGRIVQGSSYRGAMAEGQGLFVSHGDCLFVKWRRNSEREV